MGGGYETNRVEKETLEGRRGGEGNEELRTRKKEETREGENEDRKDGTEERIEERKGERKEAVDGECKVEKQKGRKKGKRKKLE